MLNPEHKKKLLTFAAFALPIIMVKAAGSYLGGPSPATAVTPASDETVVRIAQLISNTSSDSELTEEQKRAAEYIRSLEHIPLGRSPFYYPVREQRSDPEPNETEPSTPPTFAEPEFTLNAVMRSAMGGRLALIDGNVYRTGDMLNERWRLVKIHDDNVTVTIVCEQTDESEFLTVMRRRGGGRE